MLFLSIDFGTSAVKLSIVDENGETRCWAKENYPYILLPGEKVEMNKNEVWRALFAAAAKLDPELRAKVEYLCYDTFSPSPVFLDKDGDLVYENIITHMDRRSRPQTAFIDQVVGKDNYMNISGIYPFPGGCSAMTYIWFLQNEPDVYKTTYRVGHMPTYIHKQLTGEWMVDLVNASMMGLYETTTQKGWSDELIREFGLDRSLFGEIYNPGTRHGSLLPEIAEKLGVKAGIPVAVGTNDVAAAQMGAHNSKAGEMMNTTGSSEMVSILTDKPIVNPEYYLRNSALPGIWQIYATTAGGFAIDWFYDQLCREMTKKEFYAYVDRVIEECMDDYSVTFDPYMTGDRQSLEKKTGAWHGLTLEATRDKMLASMLRSMQGVLKKAIDQAAEVQKLSSTIKISGGMSTPTYIKLKQHEIPGFDFEVVDDCPILGNVELVKYYMNK
ncbi:MAG: sugar kinase [Ruminococcaceae bacterium]|nr:sugar kinase [Oscillospiraceae bacterium]